MTDTSRDNKAKVVHVAQINPRTNDDKSRHGRSETVSTVLQILKEGPQPKKEEPTSPDAQLRSLSSNQPDGSASGQSSGKAFFEYSTDRRQTASRGEAEYYPRTATVVVQAPAKKASRCSIA